MAWREAAPRLMLVDAYSLLFRAFFGGRYLSTTDQRPTGAVYGFATMLLNLLEQQSPASVVVCWDAPARTFRRESFDGYKAHRPEPDPQLRAQIPVARELVAALGLESAESPGYEADDVIGCLAQRGRAAGYEVEIVTGDTDALQLVRDGVSVLMVRRGVSELEQFDTDAVQRRYGLTPRQIVDLKALVGDTSDNIPGVPGVGEKTAVTMLQRFGDTEGVLAHAQEAPTAKARAALQQHAEQARLSRHLAEIVCDVDVSAELRPYSPGPEDWQRVRAMFEDLEFRSLIGRIPEGEASSLEPARPPCDAYLPEVVTVSSRSDMDDMLAELAACDTLAVRLETAPGSRLQSPITGVGLASKPGRAFALRAERSEPGELAAQGFAAPMGTLKQVLETKRSRSLTFQAKNAEIALERAGISAQPFTFDALLAAYLLDSTRSSYLLPDLVETHLHRALPASADAAAALAAEASALLELEPALRARVAEAGMERVLNELEIPLVPVLAAMEEAGLLVDVPYIQKLGLAMGERMEKLAAEIYGLAGYEFNIGSTRQLQEVLFDKLQLPTGRKTKTGYSTDAEHLELLAPQHEIARKILDYREVAKLKTTYADALVRLSDPTTHRVHTTFNQTVASTGRLSSSEPNLQNIPVRSDIGREIRRAFIAPPGRVLLSCDYSQIELRVMAHVTGDATLVTAFQRDEDIHAATAAAVFGVPLDQVTPAQRRQAKTINFAVIYGQSGFALASTLGVPTHVANAWIKDYFARLPGVKRYVEETTARAHRQKYVETLMGRRRYMKDLTSGNHQVRAAAERAAVNMPMQGTAADIMKLAMIRVYAALRGKEEIARILLQVHDELLLEVDERRVDQIAGVVRREMEAAYALHVPLRVDAKAGRNWADMSPVDGR